MPRIVIKEERQSQIVVEDVPPAVVSEINRHADRYPGTKIVNLMRRTYPQATLAAHVLGYLGEGEENQFVGARALKNSANRCCADVRAWPSCRSTTAAAP